MVDDVQKIGIGMTSFGVIFTTLGVVLFFDKLLLSMGNIMFLSGVTVTIGPKRALKFFVRQQNIGGSFAFVGGLTLVVCGWPIVGACMEFYGFLALFSAFFPTVFLFLKRFPIVGTFISGPWVKNLIAKLAKTSQHSLPV